MLRPVTKQGLLRPLLPVLVLCSVTSPILEAKKHCRSKMYTEELYADVSVM